VLLKLYEEFGMDCLQHLRGMFAFAIYDRKKRKLFLARDRVGKKPLKYFFAGDTFAFASELKALRTLPECPRGVDFEAVHHFLTLMYLPSTLTGFVGVCKLPAAHSLALDLQTGEHVVERYWELTYEPDERTSPAQWGGRIRAALEESVRLRMVADVPIGAFLSGGIDSATVVALMAKQSTSPVRTFSMGSRVVSHDELPDAASVAERFRTDHHPIVVDPDIVRLLPNLVATYEEPFADPSAIPTYILCREARDSVTVALNGDGGDENFAGYVRYPILRFSRAWESCRVIHPLVRLGTGCLHALLRRTFSYRCHRFQSSMHLPWPQRYLRYLSFFTEEEKRELYRDGFALRRTQGDEVKFGRTEDWYAARTQHARGRAADLLHQAMSMDVDTYLAEDLLPKVDLGSMAHGLEVRSPFLDHELLELTARIPSALKLRGWRGKWILKQCLKDILPAEVLQKRKQGFRLPLDHWFRGELRSFVRERLGDGHPLFWEIFDRARVLAFLDRYEASRMDSSDHVWALLWLREWCDQCSPH